MKKTFVFSFVMISVMAGWMMTAAQADEIPQSKCVTAGTTATHQAVMARLEKDVAPYAANEKATEVIAKYREAMDTAWAAMHEPYCGFGAYGISSAVKSYSKSVERARLAFMEGVKNLGKAPVAVVAVAPKTDVVVSAVVAKPEVIVKEKTVLTPSGMFFPGLHRGMRSDSVMSLQKMLAKHFKVSEDEIVTGFFGPRTEMYLIKLQLEKKVIDTEDAPGAGLVGPRTSAMLNGM